MPINPYGILKGRPIDKQLGTGPNPHYQVLLVDDEFEYRIAINVKSKEYPSELLYLVDEDFMHPLLSQLFELRLGFTESEKVPNGLALDYIRGNLFDRTSMRALPHSLPGTDNDLNEKIDYFISQAMGREDALVYAFGERWGPEPGKRDKYFGFTPGYGIHNIHMNQGNVARFKGDDGVWQDGGILIHFPSENRFVAIFLAFQSQTWHTDDTTGHRIETPSDGFDQVDNQEMEQKIYIIAALVNPSGDDSNKETVTLLNVSSETIHLQRWAIADKRKQKQIITAQQLTPFQTLTISLTGQTAQLSNEGGIITLLDSQGLKVHGVSYTKSQAQKSGWLLKF
ncbi:YukJ family protein [Rhodocytophaga aerolata]|uniref:YukJ family protein n=1 Tax=Rhodocytophaga aerolata TaxID=455078 RepID=A0ABT8RDT4_9BACT|nr:YukJ family protein [Rhodocytophaga aerolata]MDO1450269.1 YukJ family protein [Rhodocytophaga aerolata]